MTILGDDLYSCHPICKAILQSNFHFIFTCKPDSHKTLYECIEGLRKTEMLDTFEMSRWTGRRREFDRYVYTNKVPLRAGEDALYYIVAMLITIVRSIMAKNFLSSVMSNMTLCKFQLFKY